IASTGAIAYGGAVTVNSAQNLVRDGLSFMSSGTKSAKEGAGKSIKSGNGTLNTLTDAQKSRLNSLENTINDHLTEGDFSGTLRDLQGNPVPNGKGGFFDHMGEMKDSYNSLLKIRRGLEGSLKNPNLPEIDRALLQEGLGKANTNISRIDELFAPYGGIK
ncbi:MAG: polymorphic toxin type 28 domain-containing protein, partial [Anaerocolumna sp.]